ncbi:unnamed protein product [Protopolystoma xenopodis]|uniref:Uncharacterized protein n=1 Tax=Protopolystoma xenopodis TaxID=117903 RepID=A0A448XF67_9PLAT|nr:unnamed protein product [Protopolystoma xenopodis]
MAHLPVPRIAFKLHVETCSPIVQREAASVNRGRADPRGLDANQHGRLHSPTFVFSHLPSHTLFHFPILPICPLAHFPTLPIYPLSRPPSGRLRSPTFVFSHLPSHTLFHFPILPTCPRPSVNLTGLAARIGTRCLANWTTASRHKSPTSPTPQATAGLSSASSAPTPSAPCHEAYASVCPSFLLTIWSSAHLHRTVVHFSLGPANVPRLSCRKSKPSCRHRFEQVQIPGSTPKR